MRVAQVCAYAINQHENIGESLESLKAGPFYKAIQMAQGVVTVLDRHAVSFSRIWCIYEIFVTLFDLTRSYDIYTTLPQTTDFSGIPAVAIEGVESLRAVGILDALHPSDVECGSLQNEGFPLGLAMEALKVRSDQASTTVEEDKVRILSSIAAAFPDLPAESAYASLDRAIHLRFTTVTASQLVSRGQLFEAEQILQLQLSAPPVASSFSSMRAHADALILSAKLQFRQGRHEAAVSLAMEAEAEFLSMPDMKAHALAAKIQYSRYRNELGSNAVAIDGLTECEAALRADYESQPSDKLAALLAEALGYLGSCVAERATKQKQPTPPRGRGGV